MIATHAPLPPYVLTAPSFRFRALAMLAGRAALGGAREVALATYLVARLAHDCLPGQLLPTSVRTARAAAARPWLSSLALPASLQGPLSRLADATAGDAAMVDAALQSVIAATASYLDAGARSELDRLARALAA